MKNGIIPHGRYYFFILYKKLYKKTPIYSTTYSIWCLFHSLIYSTAYGIFRRHNISYRYFVFTTISCSSAPDHAIFIPKLLHAVFTTHPVFSTSFTVLLHFFVFSIPQLSCFSSTHPVFSTSSYVFSHIFVLSVPQQTYIPVNYLIFSTFLCDSFHTLFELPSNYIIGIPACYPNLKGHHAT